MKEELLIEDITKELNTLSTELTPTFKKFWRRYKRHLLVIKIIYLPHILVSKLYNRKRRGVL